MTDHEGHNNRFSVDESTADRNIPGFYYDRETGRYFRELRETPMPRSFTCDQEESKLSIQPKDRSLKHLPDCLMKRQLGCKINAFEKKHLKMKTMNLKLTETIDLTATLGSNLDEITFLKTGPHSFLVEYRVDKRSVHNLLRTFVSEIHHRFTPDWMRNNPFEKYGQGKCISVNDICMGFSNNDCIMFVGNSLRNRVGFSQFVWRPTSVDGVERVDRHFNCLCAVFCCCSNNFTETFAMGLQDAFSIHSERVIVESSLIKGTVYGITFNENGNLIYCALHNGNIVISDLRTPETVRSLEMDKIGLDEVVLMADERYLICGDFDGSLCKLDLRTYRKVVNYIGHVHTPWKSPFSISEPHNILCATGFDNVTRLWSLADGGKPLNNILPPIDGPVCRSGLMTDGFRVSVCMTQKQKAMIYDIYT